MKCPNCHFENPPQTSYCGKCGAQLSLKTGQEAPPVVAETLQTPVHELTTGSMFAGRYQVIEELGHGGMGKVYKIFDTKVKEKIALKLIKPEIASNREVLERFGNELRLARQISHRNVCRMFDLGEAEGAHFITMEYVHGEDLKSMIRMSTGLTMGTVLSIGKQVCEGLAEAHSLGIVHRDLKPQNIMIDKGGNAKIMDFGIARSLKEKGITGASTMIGTPEYMSPEQAEAKEVDHRSDIYSLGIILYEMATGRVPFEGDTALSIAMKHKGEIPKNPKLLNRNLPDNLATVILRCLDKDKSKRCQSAGEVRAELERVEKGLPSTERVLPARKPLTSKEITVKFQPIKLIFPALAVAVIIAAAVVFWPKKGSGLDPNIVAVAVFDNKTGDPKLDPIGSLAAERIMLGLTRVGEFSVAPMPSAEALAVESKRKDRLRALAEVTKAGKIVHGDYYLQGENIQFHAWVEDVAARKNLLVLEPASGPIADPAAALEPLRLKLMGGLAGVFDPEIKEYFALLKEPPNFEAFREYSEGLKAHNRSDYPRAVEHFLRAAELDPKLTYALGHAAVDYSNMGENAKAEELLQKAGKLRADFSNFERLTMDWVQANLRGDSEAGLRLARQIVSLTGSQVWIYLNGIYATDNNYPGEALTVLSAYDPYALPRIGRSRNYWWVLTTTHHMLGNHKRELKEARRGRKQLPETLSMLVREVAALAALGRTKELQRLFEESKTLPPQSGQSHSPGTIMLTAGRELRAHGFKEDSIRVLNQALQWFEGRPEKEKASAGNRYGRAGIVYLLERWDEAKMLFEGLHGEVPDNLDYLGYLGAAKARLGDKDGALKVSEQLEEDKRPYLYGDPTYWRARIAALLGDKEGAIDLLRQAIKQGFGYLSLHPCEDFESLTDYPPYVQFMKPKG